MKITKYEHSCWSVSEDNSCLIIDRGVYSKSLTDFSNIVAVIVSHVHADHFDPEVLQKIVDQNSRVQIFAPNQVKAEFSQNVTVPETNKPYQVSDFTLEFFGEKHHLFDDTDNIAVTVNGQFFSPGDSYTKPDKPVNVAAVPASAPWLRIDEAIENVKNIQAKIVLPTHNALLSEIGESIHYRILGEAAEAAGKRWQVLKPGESIEV
jgi:L-ascorbate metabolism protein UlaG (beta-lactamase superfamily)